MRLLQPEDADALAALEREAFADAWGAGRFGALLRQEHFLAVGAFGAGGASRLDAYASGYNLAGELEIVNVAVRENLRGQGLGTQVLLFFLQEAVRRGAGRAVLEVREGNTAARALYVRCGFFIIGTRRKYYADTGEDALVMEWTAPSC